MEKFKNKVWLSSPLMHEDALTFVQDAYEKNWVSTVGENINEAQRLAAEKTGCKYAVALSSGTAALHLALKLSGVKKGDRVFCSDLTFAASVNPVIYENAQPVFIDCEKETWNMCPKALEKAFELYPETKVIILVNLYGTPAKFDELCAIAKKHGAIIIEDAAESLGAEYKGKQTGSFGKFNAISFNGNKIITGSSGGMLLTNSENAAQKAQKWSTQSRENAPWYQHEEIGYNYRMSNIIAGLVRSQFPYLQEHIERKKAIYEKYKAAFFSLPVTMNPYNENEMQPNFWLSCMLIDEKAICSQKRTETEASYIKENGKTCPTEILEKLAEYNAEGRPIWKPMHSQPIFKKYPVVSVCENDVSTDIFTRGLCLPSDINMTSQQQDNIIEIVKSCFI